MKKYFYALLVYSMLFIVEDVYSQKKPAAKNAGVTIKQDEENLNVFQQWLRWNNPGSLLINYLTKQANDYYDIRDGEIAKLKTRNDWLARQKSVKDKLMEMVGPFPEKTPLNPRITGIVKKNGYKVEKIVYESMPGFYVTGCLYS